MGSVVETIREPSKLSGGGGSRHSARGDSWVIVATVGHEGESADRWVCHESGQVLVEVTQRTGGSPGQFSRARVAAGVAYEDFAWGEQVVIVQVGGNDTHMVIVGSLRSLLTAAPATVAGIDTGATEAPQRGDQTAGPAFTYLRTRPGRLLAVETGDLADVMVHSGAGVEIAGTVLHLSGLVHLAAGFSVPPTPPTIGVPELPDLGAGVGVVPGVPGTPFVPVVGGNPTTPPYAGVLDGLVRAKDRYQSAAGVDPGMWIWLSAVDVFLKALGTFNPVTIAAALVVYNAVPIPTSLTSAAMTASRCTAADGPEP